MVFFASFVASLERASDATSFSAVVGGFVVEGHGNQLLEKIDQGDLIKAQFYLKPLIITSMSNSWRASLQQIIQNWMVTVLGLLKSGKLRLRHTIDRGDLIKLLGEW